MRSATQPYCNTVGYGCVSLRMRFFSQNVGTIKRILPGSSSPSHREGPGIEVENNVIFSPLVRVCDISKLNLLPSISM